MRIRALRPGDLRAVRAIERDAGAAFAEIGMAAVAADPPPSTTELEAFCAAGRSYVASGDHDLPLAFLLSSILDGCAHIDQVSVSPVSAGHGIGAALIDHLAGVAAAEGLASVTLTTFRDVPWNAPYYRRLGFVVLEPAAQGRELASLIMRERSSIPGDAPRVAMRRRERQPCRR